MPDGRAAVRVGGIEANVRGVVIIHHGAIVGVYVLGGGRDAGTVPDQAATGVAAAIMVYDGRRGRRSLTAVKLALEEAMAARLAKGS